MLVRYDTWFLYITALISITIGSSIYQQLILYDLDMAMYTVYNHMHVEIYCTNMLAFEAFAIINKDFVNL